MVTVTVQWYQSHDTVTASLQLKPLPPHTNDDVVLHLEEQYCSILIAGVFEYYTNVLGLRLNKMPRLGRMFFVYYIVIQCHLPVNPYSFRALGPSISPEACP